MNDDVFFHLPCSAKMEPTGEKTYIYSIELDVLKCVKCEFESDASDHESVVSAGRLIERYVQKTH